MTLVYKSLDSRTVCRGFCRGVTCWRVSHCTSEPTVFTEVGGLLCWIRLTAALQKPRGAFKVMREHVRLLAETRGAQFSYLGTLFRARHLLLQQVLRRPQAVLLETRLCNEKETWSGTTPQSGVTETSRQEVVLLITRQEMLLI